mgnify:CR=1 FL=1
MKLPGRVFPHPWLSVSLLIGWLLLMNSVSFGNLLMAAVLACLIPWLTHVFWPRSPYRLRFGRLVLFVSRVLTDIVLANLQVAKLILGPRRQLRPAFVNYPLQLQHDFLRAGGGVGGIAPRPRGGDAVDSGRWVFGG